MSIKEIVEGRCYRIVREDGELISQWPELKPGCEFKACKVENGGVTALQVRGGRYINIKEEKDTWYWCFFCEDTSAEIEEIEELASDPVDVINHMGIFGGRRISSCLSREAAQENNDGYEGNLMQAAAEYIEWLERQLEFSSKSF